MHYKKIDISKETLERLYWQKDLSTTEIAKAFNCNKETIRKRLIRFNITRKSNSVARMRYKKFNFSEKLPEKAYLLGFRLGDLNVYQTSSTSSLVVVRCNTTHEVQISLMKKLFSKYGMVQVSKGKYSSNINCYLNDSFAFLLPKYLEVPYWVGQNFSVATAFIAGYIDAEGSFSLNQLKARFKIDSYDVGILAWMAYWLQRQGIQVKLHGIARKGMPRPNGMKYNKDLWRININEAFSLVTFIKLVKPFIKHSKRLKDILICEQNIVNRKARGSIRYGTI